MYIYYETAVSGNNLLQLMADPDVKTNSNNE